MIRFNNPAVNKLSSYENVYAKGATYGGVALKTLYFVLATFVSATASYVFALDILQSDMFMLFLVGAPLIAFVCSLIASFRPATTPVTGSLYALFEGLAIGFISAIVGAEYGGIVFAALISTVSVLLIMSVLYFTGIVRVGNFFRRFMISALLGIIISQLLLFVIGFIFPAVHALLYGNGNLSIFISVIMVIFASLMILLDLDRISQVVENGLDKKYEWFAAFGLLITLVWLYVEFLRLFLKIASRNR